MESVLKRYSRYIRYFYEWIVHEKIHGLDFTMRDKSLITKTNGVFHGYSKTDEAHCKDIFENILYQTTDGNSKWRLLDVGCGKGAFLREAAKYPFEKIDGIEIDERLVQIARKNFEILHLSRNVNVYSVDATLFAHYADYNIFYFFNPFEKEVMKTVVKKIFEECHKEFVIVLHNPVCADVVEDYGGIRVKELFDNAKSYETYIYKCKSN